jgi:hypothetical protein
MRAGLESQLKAVGGSLGQEKHKRKEFEMRAVEDLRKAMEGIVEEIRKEELDRQD